MLRCGPVSKMLMPMCKLSVRLRACVRPAVRVAISHAAKNRQKAIAEQSAAMLKSRFLIGNPPA